MTASSSARCTLALSLYVGALLGPGTAVADEGGVSFWLPGQFGSLAAAPGAPGWTLPVIDYHTEVDAGGAKNFAIGGNLTAGVDARANLVFIAPTYTFHAPVAGGGRASLSLGWAYGDMEVSAQATLTGPRGNVLRVNPRDSITSGSDLYPMLALKWNKGVHNYTFYAMGDIPVGSYRKGRLANIGINHVAIDTGAGYTYFNPQAGWEFSSVAGVTYNFENPATDYRNGLDAHIEAAVSRFMLGTMHLGLVAYYYYQFTGDSGDGAVLGDFKSRVAGIGPQLGTFLGKRKVYLNLKGYYEMDARNRPEGWNAWVTLAVPMGSAAE